MNKNTTVFPFIHRQQRPMTRPQGLFRMLIVALCLSFSPSLTVAQTNSPAPLPPAAQEALNKGILAAKIPDYLLAIRYFEEAGILPKLKPIPTRDLLDKVGKPLNGQSR
jgi:hypothetical protein